MNGHRPERVPDPRSDERRKPGTRVPFEALVEIAAPEGRSFEAESVDLSSSGMHLRTAYMPKVGTPLTFRFDAEAGQSVLVRGEVVWSADGEGGGEFGVRFADMPPEDADLLRKLVGESSPNATWTANAGTAVRIHIEGMQAPMRATLLDDDKGAATVGSELKMLRIGAMVELEDKERKLRRPARVDGVACEIDPGTHVPQLVVKLRYETLTAEDTLLPTRKAPMPAEVETAAREARSTLTPPPVRDDAERESVHVDAKEPARESQARVALPVAEDEAKADGMKAGFDAFGTKMKIAFGATAAAASRFGARIGTTVSLLSKKKGDSKEDGEVRRTTASLPITNGKPRTLRPQAGSRDFMNDEEGVMEEIDVKKVARRRQMGIAAGVGFAVILGFLAFRKPHPKEPVVAAPTPELAPAASVAIAPPPPAASAAPVETVAAATPPAPLVGDSTGNDAKGNPNPFGTPTVKKGTKMLLRLDGPVTEIKGMQMPNGFVVSVPNRKSLEAAGPLAAKDPRIASAKVVNQAGGAELTIAFKDNSPNYVVKAKGDALEIVLAHEKAVAKKNKGKNGTPAMKAPHHKKK